MILTFKYKIKYNSKCNQLQIQAIRVVYKLTIKDVATLAGVSVATVSRVINNDPVVKDKLKKKVLNIIKEYNYIPNNIGRSLRKLKSEMLLIMLPTLSNPFYSKILKGIEDSANIKGYGVLNIVTHNKLDLEQKYLNLLKTKQVDGVISLNSTLSFEEINNIAKNYPFVQCCEYTNKSNIPYVMIDNYKAAYDSVSYFIKEGHKNIALISGNQYTCSENLRKKGYSDALSNAGIEINKEYIEVSDYKPKTGYEICKKFMSCKNPPTAILAVSDMLAIGATNFLMTNSFDVGVDVEIIGFDNASITEVYMPTISTIAQPRYELGQISVDLIMEKINNLNTLNKGITLPHKLLLRQTTRRHLK